MNANQMNANQIKSQLDNGFGFGGTIQSNLKLTDDQRDAAFSAAVHATAYITDISVFAARRLLDSTTGRHLANDITDVDVDKISSALYNAILIRDNSGAMVLRKSVLRRLPEFINND